MCVWHVVTELYDGLVGLPAGSLCDTLTRTANVSCLLRGCVGFCLSLAAKACVVGKDAVARCVFVGVVLLRQVSACLVWAASPSTLGACILIGC